MKKIFAVLAVLAFAMLLLGCTGGNGGVRNDTLTGSQQANSQQADNGGTSMTPKPGGMTPVKGQAQDYTPGLSTGAPKDTIVVFETTKGTFKAKIYTVDAPITSSNFISLVNRNFYNGLIFHRYVPGFVIQGGDPTGTGTGGSGKTIPLEINPKLTHVQGALAMARTNDPNSATSQFYVTLADVHQLDGSYAVFGQVTEGMDVVLQLRENDKMTKVYLE